MKMLTSFTTFVSGEGQRISYTYSNVDESGKLVSQNNRENFIVMDSDVMEHINAINAYIFNRMDQE